MSEAVYKRVLLKLGGESLVDEEGDFLHRAVPSALCREDYALLV